MAQATFPMHTTTLKAIIQGGRVEIFQRHGGKEIIVATLGDGDFFGTMALFGEEIRNSGVRALGDVCVFTLERAGLLRRLHEDPSLAFRMLERMAKRIRDLESALAAQAEQA